MQQLIGPQIQSIPPGLGAPPSVIIPLCLVGAGMLVPTCVLLAVWTSRRTWSGIAASAFGVANLVANQIVLPDDYAGEHTAWVWVSAILAGSVLIHLIRDCIRRWQGSWLVAITAACILGIAWVPSDSLRVEMLRPPGSVASWVLSRWVWTSPQLIVPIPNGSKRPIHSMPPRGKYPDDPVVVLITVEAFRGDLLDDGRFDASLPHMASLRDTGAYFPRAYSASSQTAVSLTSLFAGRHCSQLRWEREPRSVSRAYFATQDPAPRFPSLLTCAGVDTKSYVGIKTVAEEFGVTGAFMQQHVLAGTGEFAPADVVMPPLLDEIEKAKSGPHFYYAHLTEPHAPYDRGRVTMGPDFERYLSEVAVVDQWVGRLADTLQSRFSDRGYIILTGDHGEAFGEHGTRFHSKTLYEEVIHVPLIVWGPGIGPQRVRERVGHVDIAPTILQLFGQQVPPEQMGQSLLPLIEGQVDRLQRPLVSEVRVARALFGPGDLKVIEDSRRHVVEVYDLERDPKELDNLFDKQPQKAHPLVAELRAFVEAYRLKMPPDYEPPYRR
jgi:arylsulfatase A-like enzyme